jgi:hypothetical protein
MVPCALPCRLVPPAATSPRSVVATAAALLHKHPRWTACSADGVCSFLGGSWCSYAACAV